MESQTRKSKKSQQSIRQASRTDYQHRGINVCRKFFRYLHCVGDDKITDMIKHYKENDVERRVHGNTKKLPKNALEYKDTKAVVDFILNFATLHAIQLPGRTLKHWVSDAQLLPTDMNKATVYAQYKASMDAEPAGKLSLFGPSSASGKVWCPSYVPCLLPATYVGHANSSLTRSEVTTTRRRTG